MAIDFEVRTVKVSQVTDNSANARSNLQAVEGSIDRLALDIKTNGLHNAPVVIETANGKYEVIAGSRRFAAIGVLGWNEMPVKIAPKTASRRLVNISENADREDLSTYDLAKALSEAQDKEQLTGTKIANGTGLAVSYVNNLIRCWKNLPKSIKEDWAAGHPMATKDNLAKIAGYLTPEKKPDHAKMTASWNALIGADEGGEGGGESGGEGGGESGGEEKAPPINVRKRATELVGYLSEMEDVSDVNALQCLQYALGMRKTLPPGVKRS